MSEYYLSIHLLSDATFGRGEGLAGLVDVEIEHDEYGLPTIGGRTIKGLLQEEWQNLRSVLGANADAWETAGLILFGKSGAMFDGASQLAIGDATLHPTLVAAIMQQLAAQEHEPAAVNAATTPQQVLVLTPADVLGTLTTIRRQTAIDAQTGAPELGSLRSTRVLLRETTLFAPLSFANPPAEQTLALLAACVLAVRRGGVLRNRGRGHLHMLLHTSLPDDAPESAMTQRYMTLFANEVR